MSNSIQLLRDDVKTRLNNLISKAQSTKASAAIYPIYQSLQVQRFMTNNASEGNTWPAYKRSEYAEYKKRRYAGFPGGGSKMLIATSTLAGAVIGPGAPFVSEGIAQHRATFGIGSMQIAIEEGELNLSDIEDKYENSSKRHKKKTVKNAEGKPFIYPSYVQEKRPFMTFSDVSIQKMKDALKQFMVGG